MNPSLLHSITPLPAHLSTYFYAAQIAWIEDDSPLKFCVKSRQTGFSYANCFRLVLLVSAATARFDAYIVSRDQRSADLSLEDCLHWADLLHCGATNAGEILFDRDSGCSAYTLQFANGRRIYSLSSNPNALAGKRGHVTLDEFALHPDQRLLYRVAKPVTMWGGQLSIISTPRGTTTLFNQIYRAIKQSQSAQLQAPDATRNPQPALTHPSSIIHHPSSSGLPSSIIHHPSSSGLPSSIIHHPSSSALPSSTNPPPSSSASFGSQWSLHEVPIQRAVAEGLVERINQKKGTHDSRQAFLAALRAGCIDQEQWDQEYCCLPSDEAAAFFPYDLLDPCTDPNLQLLSFAELQNYARSGSTLHATRNTDHAPTLPRSPAPTFFLGMDVARHRNLCVIDVGEKLDGLMLDRLRLEFTDQTFTQIEAQLYPLLALPQLKRACIDQSGMGVQLAERARERFGWKVEPINFTAPMKEQLAFALRRDFEDGRLRISADDHLRTDLRALKKELSPSGKITFIGQVENSHCDRTWAKALRQHAARHRPSAGAILI